MPPCRLVLFGQFTTVNDGTRRLLFDERYQWLSLFNNVCGKLRSVCSANVLCRMRNTGRYKENVTWLDRLRWLAINPVFERTFKNVYDLFSEMCVPWRHISRVKI